MTGCPRKDCPKYRGNCWKHCIYCGADILWKPKGMDFNVKYNGPKPLDPKTGKKHHCTTDIIEETRPSHDLAFFLWYFYPSLTKHLTYGYYRGRGPQQPCGNEECDCARIEKMRWEHAEVASQWNKERAEWLAAWNQPVDPTKYKVCRGCDKQYKPEKGLDYEGYCSPCYWTIVQEAGGIPFQPIGFDYSNVDMTS